MILTLLLFLLPTQLAIHFWPSSAFVFGIRVDYLAPAIYLTDILALVLILTNLKIYKKYLKYIFILLGFAIFNSLFSTAHFVSAYKWLKIFEIAGVGIYFAAVNVDVQKSVKTLFYSAATFSLIGIFQFVIGKNMGGLMYYLGERSFNVMTPGIALVKLFGQDYLRSYSTFSHPNSLAGYLGIVLILLLGTGKKSIYEKLGLFMIALCFVFTFSLNAYFALIVILIIKYALSKKKYFFKIVSGVFFASFLFSLLLPMFSKQIAVISPNSSQSVSQRLDLSYAAGKMISEKFLVGEGLNTFISNIPRFKGILSYSWILQPVHNVPLLIFSETGVLGLVFLFILSYLSIKTALVSGKNSIMLAMLFVVITWTLDHYWFTLQQNLLLVSILLGLSYNIRAWKTR